MTITTVAINCDIGLANATEFTASQLEFTLSQPDYDTVSSDSIPAATVIVSLDASGVATANLWPVDRGVRNSFYAVVLVGSRTINGRLTSERFILGNIAPPALGAPFTLANLLSQSSGGIAVGSTIYATLADAVAAAVAAASTATTQAGTATTQAGIATTQAGNAANSATQAQNFATAAAAVGSTYPSVAAGIAAVANGAVFFVPIAGGIGLTVYQRSGASANVIGSVQGDTFDTRAAYTAWVAAGGVAVSGRTYSVAGLPYIGRTGATSTGLNGLVPNPAFDLSVAHFGAIGTGLTADIATNNAAFAAAVAYINALPLTFQGKPPLYIPAGHFCVSQQFTFNNVFGGIVGAGMRASLIANHGDPGDLFVFQSSTPTAVIGGMQVRDVAIRSFVDTTSGALLAFRGITNLVLNNVQLDNHFGGLLIEGGSDIYVSNLHIFSGNAAFWSGVKVGSYYVKIKKGVTTSVAVPTELFFTNFNWRRWGTADLVENGLVIEAVDGAWFSNGHIMGVAEADFLADSTSGDQMSSPLFSNVWFDNNSKFGVKVIGAGTLCGGFTFTGCTFLTNTEHAIAIAAGCAVRNITVTGGMFSKPGKSAIIAEGGNGTVAVTGATFMGCGSSLAGARCGIEIRNDANVAWSITGNTFTNKVIGADTVNSQWGIRNYSDTANNITITGNTFDGMTAGDIEDNRVGRVKNYSGNMTSRTYANVVAVSGALDIDHVNDHFLVASSVTSFNNLVNRRRGRTVTLEFTAACTATHGLNLLELAGGVNFVAAAKNTLTLRHNGTYWIEIGRKT